MLNEKNVQRSAKFIGSNLSLYKYTALKKYTLRYLKLLIGDQATLKWELKEEAGDHQTLAVPAIKSITDIFTV